VSCKHALCIFCYENLSEITKNAKQNSKICKNAAFCGSGSESVGGKALEAENSCCLCLLLSADDARPPLPQSYEKLLSVYKMVAGCEPLRILQVHHVHQILKQATDAKKNGGGKRGDGTWYMAPGSWLMKMGQSWKFGQRAEVDRLQFMARVTQ